MKTLTLSIACGLALITATSAWASEPPRVGRSRRQIRAQGMLRSAASVAPRHRPAAAGRINAIQRGAIARYRQRFGAEVGLDGVDGEMPNAALSPNVPSAGAWIGYEGVDGERPLPLSIRRPSSAFHLSAHSFRSGFDHAVFFHFLVQAYAADS